MSSPLLSIPKEACNSESLTIFDLSAFKLLQSIEIGNENMYHTNSLLIDNINTRIVMVKMILDHSEYQIVTNWNPLKSINIVSVIILVNLN